MALYDLVDHSCRIRFTTWTATCWSVDVANVCVSMSGGSAILADEMLTLPMWSEQSWQPVDSNGEGVGKDTYRAQLLLPAYQLLGRILRQLRMARLQ